LTLFEPSPNELTINMPVWMSLSNPLRILLFQGVKSQLQIEEGGGKVAREKTKGVWVYRNIRPCWARNVVLQDHRFLQRKLRGRSILVPEGLTRLTGDLFNKTHKLKQRWRHFERGGGKRERGGRRDWNEGR